VADARLFEDQPATTPLADRWGGWYVTGTHGSLKHLGNLIVRDPSARELPSWTANRTLSTVAGRFDTDGYPTPRPACAMRSIAG